MINENLKLSGQLNIVLKDKAGNVKDSRDLKNLVVNTGLAYIASRMKDTTKGAMSHMALGSGTTAAVAKSLGRDYIGCELHEDYGNLIQKRVGEYHPVEEVSQETGVNILDII